jgi:SAM-dependent methyltransferase
MGRWGKDSNFDQGVIDGFGYEWSQFEYFEDDSGEALDRQFDAYCAPINLLKFNEDHAIAADFGAGSGRWTSRLVPYFKFIYALEPSDGASSVLEDKFKENARVKVLKQTIGDNSIPDESLDFGISLGVLHHIPNTSLALKDISRKIKGGGDFLCYLYYNLEDRPLLYRYIFKCANVFRLRISRMSHSQKKIVTFWIAASVYFPLSRFSRLASNLGLDVKNFPLHQYARLPFKMLANDSLDRFGTALEQRFSKKEIREMLQEANFDIETLVFSQLEPYWTFSVKKCATGY